MEINLQRPLGDSNPWLSARQADTLTAELRGQGERGGNWTPDGSYVTVLQTAATHIANSSHSPTMGLVGLEPTTNRLKARYSTIELQTHVIWYYSVV